MEYTSLTSLIKHLEDGSRSTHAIEIINKSIVVKASKELSQYIGGKGCDLSLLLDLLNTIQHACKYNNGCSIHLIQVGILNLMAVIFTRTLETLTRDGSCEPLQAVTELATETANVIVDSNSTVKSNVVSKLLPFFMDLLGHKQLTFPTRFEVLKSTNMLMEQTCIDTREKLLQNDVFSAKVASVVQLINCIGDYEFQVGVVECLMRLFPKKSRRLYASQLFPDMEMAYGFLNIKDRNFEVDCRVFLNEVNAESEDPTKGVFSFPCVSAFVGDRKLEKPSDDGYEEFWVDFNIGSERITLFCEQDALLSQGSCKEEELWETVAICKTDVKRCAEDVVNGMIHLEITLKNPLCEIYPSQQGSMTSNKVLIKFNRDLQAHVTHAVEYTFCSVAKNKVSAVQRPLKISTKEVEIIDSQSQLSVPCAQAQPFPGVGSQDSVGKRSPGVGSQDSVGKRCRVSVPIVAMVDPINTSRSPPVVPPKPQECRTKAAQEKVRGKSAAEKPRQCQSADPSVTKLPEDKTSVSESSVTKLPEDKTSVSESSESSDEATSDDKCRGKKAGKPTLNAPKTPPAKKSAKPKVKVKTPVVTVTPPFKRTRGRLAKGKCKSKPEPENTAVNVSKKTCSATNVAEHEKHAVVIPDSLPLNSGKEKMEKQKRKKNVGVSNVKTMDDSGVGIDDSRSTFGNISMSSVTVDKSTDKQQTALRSEVPNDVKQSQNKTTNNSSSEKRNKQVKECISKYKSSIPQTVVITNNESGGTTDVSSCTRNGTQQQPKDIAIHQEAVATDLSSCTRNGTQLQPEDTSIHQEVVAKDTSCTVGNKRISTERDDHGIDENATESNADVQQENVCVNEVQQETVSVNDVHPNEPDSIPDSIENQFGGVDETVSCINASDGDDEDAADTIISGDVNGGKELKTDKSFITEQNDEPVQESRKMKENVGQTCATKNKAKSSKSKNKNSKCKKGKKSFTDVDISLKEMCDLDLPRNRRGREPCDSHIDVQHSDDLKAKGDDLKSSTNKINDIPQADTDVYLFCEPDKDFNTDISTEKKSVKLDREQKKPKQKTAHSDKTKGNSKRKSNRSKDRSSDVASNSSRSRNMHSPDKAESNDIIEKEQTLVDNENEKERCNTKDSANCQKGVFGSHHKSNLKVGVFNDDECFGEENMEEIEGKEVNRKRDEKLRTPKASFDLSKNSYHIVPDNDMSPSNDNMTPETGVIDMESLRSRVGEHFVKEKQKKPQVKKYDRAVVSRNNVDCTAVKSALMNERSTDIKKPAFINTASPVASESDSLYIESDDSYNARRFNMDGNRFKRSVKKKKIHKRTSAKMQTNRKDAEDTCSDMETDLMNNTISTEKISQGNKKKTQSKANNQSLVTNNMCTENAALIADNRCSAGNKKKKSKQKVSPAHEMDGIVEQTQFDNDFSGSVGAQENTKKKNMIFQMTYSHCQTKYSSKGLVQSYSACKQNIAYDPYDFDTHCDNASMKSERLEQLDISKDFKKRHKGKAEIKSSPDTVKSNNASIVVHQKNNPSVVRNQKNNASMVVNQKHYNVVEEEDEPCVIDSDDTSIQNVDMVPACSRSTPLLVQDKVTNRWYRNHSNVNHQKMAIVKLERNKQIEDQLELQNNIRRKDSPKIAECGVRRKDSPKIVECGVRRKDSPKIVECGVRRKDSPKIVECGVRRKDSPKIVECGVRRKDSPEIEECGVDSPVHMDLDDHHTDDNDDTLNTFSRMVKNFEASRTVHGNKSKPRHSSNKQSGEDKENSKKNNSLDARSRKAEGSREEKQYKATDKSIEMDTSYREIERMRRMSPQLDISIGDISIQTPALDDSIMSSPEERPGKGRVNMPLDINFLKQSPFGAIGTPNEMCGSSKTGKRARRRQKSVSYKDRSDSDDSIETSSAEKSVDTSLSFLNDTFSSKSEKSWIRERKKPSRNKDISKTYYKPHQPNKWERLHHSPAEEEESDDITDKHMEVTGSLPVSSNSSFSMPSVKLQLNTFSVNATPNVKDMSVEDFQFNIPSLRLSDLDLPESSASVKSRCSSKFSITIPSECSRSVSSQSSGKRGRKQKNRQEIKDLQDMIEMPVTPHKAVRQKNEDDDIEEIQTQENYSIPLNKICDDDDMNEIGSVCMSGLLKTPQLYLKEEEEQYEHETQNVARDDDAQNVARDMTMVLPASGLISGPSSEVRPSRSVLKRKFPNVVVDTDCSNTSDPESDTEMERSTLIPKKLFKLAPTVDRQPNKLSTLPSVCSEVMDDTDMDLLQSNVPFMRSFGQDLQKQMQEKKRKLESLTLSTQKDIQRHFNQSWVEQQQYFSNTNDNYAAKMITELSNLEKVINKSKEMETKTEELHKYQMEMLRSNEAAQMSCLKNMRRNQEDLRARTRKVVKYNKTVHTSIQEQLKKNMSSLKQKLVQDAQRQELMNVRLGLQKFF